MREDRSTDLAGAAYYARIFGGLSDLPDDRPDVNECRGVLDDPVSTQRVTSVRRDDQAANAPDEKSEPVA